MEEINSPRQSKAIIPVKKYNTLSLNFEPKQTPIDYFKLSTEVLNDDDEMFDVSVNMIDLSKDRYFNIDKHIPEFDYTLRNTTVFNFQTGKGKSSTFYKLIELYEEAGYHVIICSPFQKLVEKDFGELKKALPEGKIFNYLQLQDDEVVSDNNYIPIVARPIHIMTINCLLQNPGENSQDQSLVKRRYLSKLKQFLIDYDKKVVLFFDELHEAVHNFKGDFLRHLLDWEKLTFKCFISSATYSFSSVPVIQRISLLTECKISIYQADRVKNEKQAKLHLHITDISYNQYYFSSLNYLEILIERYKKENRKINILTGHKSLANALTGGKGNERLVKLIESLSPNVVTGESGNEFDLNGNNIGTSFKTGIDITEEKGVLIIILPAIKNDNKANYGIFTDGFPSLIQAISRIRNGGDIHVFMYKPPVIIDLEGHKTNISEILHDDAGQSVFFSCNSIFEKLKISEDFKNKRSASGQDLTSALSKVAPELGIHKYTFWNYLLDNSAKHCINIYPSMGKFLSPYVLWASINNQFCNTTLNSITYLTNHYKEIKLSSNDDELYSQFLELLTEDERKELRKLPIRKIYAELPNHFESSMVEAKNSEGEIEFIHFINRFQYKEKVVGITTLKTYQSFKRMFLEIAIYLKTDRLVDLDKEKFIRTSLNNAISHDEKDNTSELIAVYKQLADWRNKFITFIESQIIQHEEAFLIHKDYGEMLPDELHSEAIALISHLAEKDELLKCFSFFQKTAAPSKEKIAGEFEGTFTNITGIQKSYKGERKYYLLNTPIQNDSFLQDIDFLT